MPSHEYQCQVFREEMLHVLVKNGELFNSEKNLWMGFLSIIMWLYKRKDLIFLNDYRPDIFVNTSILKQCIKQLQLLEKKL